MITPTCRCLAILWSLLAAFAPAAAAQEDTHAAHAGFTGFIFLTDSQGTWADIDSELTAGGKSTSGYPQAYKNAHPGHPVWQLGQPGRGLGKPANRDDGGNTHYGRWSKILAASGSDVVLVDGPNDFGDSTFSNATAYVDALQVFTGELRAAGRRVHVATVPPASSSFAPNASGAYNVWRDAMNTEILARGAKLADSILPFGSHPYFGTSAAPAAGVSGDGLHWSLIGQTAVGGVLNAALPAIAGASTATSPVSGDWFGADIPSAAGDSANEREWMVAGLGVDVHGTLAISGPGGAFRVGSGPYGTAPRTVRNGDLVGLRVTAAAAAATARAVTMTLGTGSDVLTVTTATGPAATTVFSATNKHKDTLLSYGGRRMTAMMSGAFCGARSSTAATGKQYAEIRVVALPSAGGPFIGVVGSAYSNGLTDNAAPPNGPADGAYVCSTEPNATLYAPGANARNLWANGALKANDVIGIAVDATAGRVWFRLNDVWMHGDPAAWDSSTATPRGDPAAGTGGTVLALDAWHLFGMMRSGGLLELNCGQEPFAHPAPAGFTPWR